MNEKRFNEKSSERGMVTILMAVAIVGVIGVAAFAVDIGSALVTKAELQNTADAAALAATRELALIYKNPIDGAAKMSTRLSDHDLGIIRAKASKYSGLNHAAGTSIELIEEEVSPQTYNKDTGDFPPSLSSVRAITVIARRDENKNESVRTTLGNVLGVPEIGITATSGASLSGIGGLKAGAGEFPIGLDEAWFETHSCGTPEAKIQLHPTGPDSCAGWHTFTDYPPTARKLQDLADALAAKSFVSPPVAIPVVFNFIGGVTSALPNLKVAFDNNQVDGSWLVNAPVYKRQGCGSNPNKPIPIVGFAKVRVTKVLGPPSNLIQAQVECGVVDGTVSTTGGGDLKFGAFVTAPSIIR